MFYLTQVLLKLNEKGLSLFNNRSTSHGSFNAKVLIIAITMFFMFSCTFFYITLFICLYQFVCTVIGGQVFLFNTNN